MYLSIRKFGWSLLFLFTVAQAVESVTLTTREYDNYRRFILSIPENKGQMENSFLRPIITSTPDSGLFNIEIRSEKVQQYEGERLRKSEGKIPVRFIISYPDSNTLLIEGSTTKFDKITSFFILDENKYVFDLYRYDTDDYYYSNSVQLLNNEKPESTAKSMVPLLVNPEKEREKNQGNTSSAKVSLLTKSIQTAAMILSGIIFIIIATYFILKIYSGKSLFRDISKLSQATFHPEKQARKQEILPEPETTVQVNMEAKAHDKEATYSKPVVSPVIDESAVNSMLFDKKERQIRRIMNQKNLNYNEAEMVYNLSHGSFVG
ncbi:MAG: hypothetical protein JXQ65_07735 [Candidatus Marinimicrobia bacterium]|nr:hypothetical protein [Candidatus Neomarinimicrobiota bacterium]